eukprot:TRINITY_DN23701_c0_g1_i1.p1 TRINITY_DN23701_c0_g1~~TRINITY_DN23701_c0_g1_i1.p1  ORF type:complete len:141 (+),score=15.58 TRINITY_DN23701_c0_g1_i1:3-425(+)
MTMPYQFMPQMPASPNGSPMVPFDTVASSLRSEIERAERRLEDSNRAAQDDRKGFQAQIDSLYEELKRERDARMKLQTLELNKGFEAKLQDMEKARDRLEEQVCWHAIGIIATVQGAAARQQQPPREAARAGGADERKDR